MKQCTDCIHPDDLFLVDIIVEIGYSLQSVYALGMRNLSIWNKKKDIIVFVKYLWSADTNNTEMTSIERFVNWFAICGFCGLQTDKMHFDFVVQFAFGFQSVLIYNDSLTHSDTTCRHTNTD